MKRIHPRNRLVDWAVAREKLRLQKESGEPPPWTPDPILREYRFCNVRRRDDRVSRWLIQNVLSRQDEFSQWTFLQWSALCRWINWPATLEAALNEDFITHDGLDFGKIARLMEARHSYGMKTWTGAYIIRAPSKRGGYGGWTKSRFICEEVVHRGMNAAKDKILEALEEQRLETIYNVLCDIPNWGQFMAGQVIADWTYTPVLSMAADLYAWAPMGPGSRRGYNRMMGLPLKHPAPHPEVWNFHLGKWRLDIVEATCGNFDPNTFTLHDVQNCLCELDKFERARLGEGRPRARYDWRQGDLVGGV
jgi:hypothetical protein